METDGVAPPDRLPLLRDRPALFSRFHQLVREGSWDKSEMKNGYV